MWCKEIHVAQTQQEKVYKVCDMVEFSNEDIKAMSTDTIVLFLT